MKKYSLEKYKENKKNKKMTKVTVITLLAIAILVIVALYMANNEFRTTVDRYVLRKEVLEENTNSITIDTENLSLVYAFDRKLAIYTEGNLSFYNSAAKEISNIEITLSKPIAASKNSYLALGDLSSQKACLVKSNNLVWQKDIEGTVSKISVNKNGYVAISAAGTTYESMVMLYNPKGELLFTKYLSTYVMAIDISENNKYLAIAEIDNSGIAPTNKVEIISTELARTDSENATVNTYEAQTNEVLTGIKFQSKNNLLCSFDTCVVQMDESSSKKIYDITELTAYADIRLKNNFLRIDKEKSSVFKSDYRLKISNAEGREKSYIIEGNLQSVVAHDQIIALNLGKKVEFINNNGRLVKRYISTDEINNIIISDKIAAIIYKDRINIVDL